MATELDLLAAISGGVKEAAEGRISPETCIADIREAIKRHDANAAIICVTPIGHPAQDSIVKSDEHKRAE